MIGSSALLDPRLVAVLVGGVLGGLVLLVRGFGGFRTAGRVSGTSASRIASIAAGEVLVTGAVEPIELTLVSPLQSAACLYYRARVEQTGESEREVFREERAVGFRVRDASGAIRVFPARARFDVADRFDERADRWGIDPPGLSPRTGSAYGPGEDREAQIAALLTVHDPRVGATADAIRPSTLSLSSAFGVAGSGRRFTEARIDPGDVVTVLGSALPFRDLADPGSANLLDGSGVAADDPEIAADLAAARAAGTLAPSTAAAWGNAAIEGFGIGQPVRAPVLDPAAAAPPPPDPALAARARDAFDIPPDALVIAAMPDQPLLISLGPPAMVAARQQGRFLLGLLGAVVSIASAMTLAIVLGGGLR